MYKNTLTVFEYDKDIDHRTIAISLL